MHRTHDTNERACRFRTCVVGKSWTNGRKQQLYSRWLHLSSINCIGVMHQFKSYWFYAEKRKLKTAAAKPILIQSNTDSTAEERAVGTFIHCISQSCRSERCALPQSASFAKSKLPSQRSANSPYSRLIRPLSYSTRVRIIAMLLKFRKVQQPIKAVD